MAQARLRHQCECDTAALRRLGRHGSAQLLCNRILNLSKFVLGAAETGIDLWSVHLPTTDAGKFNRRNALSITTKKLIGATAAAGLILGLAACGQAPEQGANGGGEAAAADFIPCIVSDAGGFDDRSFN